MANFKLLNFISGLTSLVIGLVLAIEIGLKYTPAELSFLAKFPSYIFYYSVIDTVVRLFVSKSVVSYLIKHPFNTFGISFLITGLYFVTGTALTPIWIQGGLILLLISRIPDMRFVFQQLKFNPMQLMVLGFVLSIFIGALLLSLPISLEAHQELSFINALFTATSAVCVTGLTTVDTGLTFSRTGETIILLLIQIGGLGIMSFSAILSLMLSKKFSLNEGSMYQESYATRNKNETRGLIKSIFKYALYFEIIGASLLFIHWRSLSYSWQDTAFNAIFHSVSAFCNAGFSVFSDSLLSFQSDPITLLTIAALIIIGGLGFPVLFNISQIRSAKKSWSWLSLQSKLALSVTLFLLILGTLFFIIGEWNHALKWMSVEDKLLNAFFQSVSARTAGFNSIEFGFLQPATLLAIMTLMFIGACPGSTGGGIKTTTFGILLVTLINNLKSKDKTHIFKRKISIATSTKASAIITISAIMIPSFTYLLLVSDHTPFLPTIFEIVSAFGTVGLSLGLTPDLSSAGKWIMMAVMLVGRVGALSIAFAFTRKDPQTNYTYPEESVLIT